MTEKTWSFAPVRRLHTTLLRTVQKWTALVAIQSVLTLAVSAQLSGVLREVYTGIPGNAVSDLTSHPSFPANPSFEEVITTGFEAPTDVLEEYGQRMSAYLIAPANGNYTFWIASDDNSVLYLSTDESPANKQAIASVPGWTSSRAWTTYPEQQSAPVPLFAGQKYYIEALMKEGNGGDNLAVRWRLPSGTIEEPIANARLEVFGLGPPEITEEPSNVTVAEGGSATFTVELARATGATYQWQRNSVNISGATQATYVRSPVSLSDHNTQYRCLITNPYGNAASSQATLTVQADTTRPTIVSATPLGDSEAVTVLFSEGVAQASGTLHSNYSINNGVTISSASFAGDNRTILLRTSPMVAGVTYTLTVNNVRDLATTPNTILPNSQTTFSFDFTPLDISAIRGVAEPRGPSSRATPLVITEIMYNPAARLDGREVEFVEIYNSDVVAMNISGFRISGEIDYTFPTNTVVPAGGFLVVAPVPADITAVYGIANVAGGFTQRLSNGGGTIRLRNKSDAILLEIEYSNDWPWPVAADNTGHSLVLARPSYGENDHRAWAASDVLWGTPGTFETTGANPYRTIFINEILAHTDDPELDYIELFNYGSASVDLTGCVLSDRPDLNKFVIPSGTIPARGYMVFNQNQLGFALSTLGETVYLKNPSGTRVLDAVRFEAQENGVALGRYPDAAPGWHELTSKTPGQANSKLRIREVVINEIMYNPISGDDNDEFVELHNRSGSPVDIGGWRFVEGIEFSFPANTTIPGNGFVVVAKNASRLMTNYPGLNAGNTFGNYDGTLANGGERLALAKFAQTTVTNNGVPVAENIFIIADEVFYNDGGRWSRWADGGGSSLELIDPHSDNRLMANWADSDESAKSSWTFIEHTGVMDHGQGTINELHVMLLGRGECLVDNLEVRESSGANLLVNSTFDSGLDGWVIQGNHVQSGLSSPGYGGSGQALHIRASSGGDNGANRVETDLTTTMTPGNTGTIRGRARWLRGHPDLLLRVHGNHIEAAASLSIPKNLGTPGAVNSQHQANIGPAIHSVKHSPVLPAANQAVVVTAQVNDPDSLASLVLKYRVDPATNYTTISMSYRGAGFYSATIPGHSAGTLVAFYLQATDGFSPAQTTLFPAEAPEQEALVRFGDPTPSGNFGIYRLWMTQKNINTWSSREKLSNESLDGTFVYGNHRAIYNAGGRYRGSPFIRPGYNTPTGTRCAYVWRLPEDDLFLGTDELNLDSLEPGDRDPTALREVTSFWMADQLGLPFSYQRYVHVVVNGVPNSSRGIPIYADTQQPDSQFMRTWFPDDDRGEIFKIDDWFEFNDSVAREFNVDARLENYTTTGGAKKQARYRWGWEKKFNRTLNDDYTSLFSLVDALNAPDSTYVSQVENTINVDDWITVFALRHAVGDWDGYGYNRGKNQFAYKPFGSTWKMLLWDLDFSLGCNGGHAPTHDLFQVNDPTIARLYNHPHFRRAYLNALHRIAYGPFESANVVSFLTARYNAFQANGVSTTSPFVNSGAQNIPVTDWISQRRTYIINELAAISAGFAITSNSGNNFSTAENFITLTGTAPIEVKFIEVNGISYPIIWTSTTTWTIQLALGAASNNLTVRGYDYYGRAVTGAQDTITINYTGSVELPQDALVINEIMYNPLTPSSSFVEIFNRSTMSAFDLSTYILNGADFTFAEGTIIQPGGYLVVANNVTGFIAAYGNTIPISGVMDGSLDNGGETLKLIAPGATPEQDVVIDEVTYDDDAPWPPLAAGFGPSLQLIDSAADNNRVGNWDALAGGGGGGSQSLIAIADTWKYNDSATDLGTNWRNTGYNDASWPSGPALHYVESAALPAPKNTPLTLGASTYYFRKTFNFTGNPATTTLRINTVIDDGAVFYLNGVEVLRLGMPATAIVYDTFANRVVDNAAYEGPFTISSANLVEGNNVLAVEVHQTNPGSSDVVFGMTLDAESTAESPYTPGAVNSTRATLGTIPLVWLNEIQPNNVSGLQDNAGDRDPWVELYNSGSGSIDLSGYYLSDDYVNLTKWPFPASTTITAGQFRVVWLDNETGETSGANLHANFRASSTNGSVFLTKVSGSVTSVVDYLNYNTINIDRSYGAYPDGTPTKRMNFYYATPAAPNDTSYPGTPVFINEWMAGNSAVVDPADGDYDDWFELYNAGPTDIDLSGFRLTDTAANPTKWTVPFGTIIPAGGHLLIWADEELNQNSAGSLHADFKLSLGGEAILLYAPNGNLVDSVSFGPQTNNISQGRWPDGNSELYFMTTFTPGAANTIGSSENVAPVLNAIGNKSGNEKTPITFTASASDANPGQNLTFSLGVGFPVGATINPTSGAFTWTPAEADGSGVFSVTVRVTDDGTPAMSDFETISITVHEVNSAPTLAPIGDRLVQEGNLLTFTALGSDTDIPAQSFSYSLDEGAPAGAAINPTSGVFTWAPTESQGPGEYTLTIIVTDDGSPALNASETIRVTVGELNSAPTITDIPDQSVDEGTTLSFTATGADADLPPQTLTYTFLGAPTGAAINSASGAFTWTPTEAQGPSVHNISVVVTDNGVPARSATNQFTVTVNEVNSAPSTTPVADVAIPEGQAFAVTITAEDADEPAQTLTYSLLTPPTGATIDAATGEFSWTPSEAQGPSVNTISVVITDNGTPALRATNEFTITVNEVNAAPTTTAVTDQSIPEAQSFSIAISAADEDLPAQTLTYSLLNPPTGATINAATGEFSWTPSEAQGPGSFDIQVRIADDGQPQLAVTNSFTLTVSEVNSEPALDPVQDYTVVAGQTVSFTAAATEPDLPAQTLTFALESGAPTGARIDASTGLFTWTPSTVQAPSTNTITIRVTDDGSPAQSQTASFEVIVRLMAAPEIVASTAGAEFLGTWNSEPGTTYRVLYRDSIGIGAWQELTEVTATGTTSIFTDALPATGHRFYLIEVLP